MDRAAYWNAIYAKRGEHDVSWFEDDPLTSMRFVRQAIQGGARSALDVGGGASRLADRLIDEPIDRVAVLDVSAEAESIARARLGPRADQIRWIVGDVTTLDDVGTFGLWHDRAVFHFLTDTDDRAHYLQLLSATVPVNGYVVMATFAIDGPERCSGLDVCRYDAAGLSDQLGDGFHMIDQLVRTHVTPRGIDQRFTHALFRRTE